MKSYRIPWRAHILVPVLLAAGLRLAHLGFLAARDPLFLLPVVDSWHHARLAYQALDTGLLLPGTQAFYKGPLYTYVLVALFALFGRGPGGIVAAYLFSVLCGIATVWLIARSAERLGGRRAAWLAGIAAAGYGTAVYLDTTLLMEPLVGLLVLGAADRLQAAQAERNPGRALVAAGLLLGLLTITRANGVLAVVLAAATSAWAARHGRWPRLTPARTIALVLGPALLVIAPVTARNVILERDPVLVSWNGGINAFMGNDPGFDQTAGNWEPNLTWMRLYNAPFDLGLTRGADHQRFFLRQTVERFFADPWTGLRILGHKTLLLFTAYEIPNNRRIEPARDRSPILALLTLRLGPVVLPCAVLLPLLGAGMALLRREQVRSFGPTLALSAAWALVPILFFHTARYRIAAIQLLLPLGAAGWARLGEIREARPRVRAALTGAFLAVLAVVTVPSAPGLPPSDEVNLADVAIRENRWDDAQTQLLRAVAAEPDDPYARTRLADVFRHESRCPQALPHYERIRDREDLDADWRHAAMRSYARCLAGVRRYADAIAWYRSYVQADPDRPRTHGHPDFHLRGTPPLQACLARLETADTLGWAGQRPDALAELDRIVVDCAQARSIVEQAEQKRRAGSGKR